MLNVSKIRAGSLCKYRTALKSPKAEISEFNKVLMGKFTYISTEERVIHLWHLGWG